MKKFLLCVVISIMLVDVSIANLTEREKFDSLSKEISNWGRAGVIMFSCIFRLGPGPWSLAHGPRPMCPGLWAQAHGPGPMVPGPWAQGLGPWPGLNFFVFFIFRI